jgi:uncharacterized protein YciI
MFVVIISYKKPLEIIDQFTAAHRQYLDECYANNLLLVSGPQIPRSGGIIIANVKTQPEVQQIIAADPFYLHDVADYQIIEFNPLKHHPALAKLLC